MHNRCFHCKRGLQPPGQEIAALHYSIRLSVKTQAHSDNKRCINGVDHAISIHIGIV